MESFYFRVLERHLWDLLWSSRCVAWHGVCWFIVTSVAVNQEHLLLRRFVFHSKSTATWEDMCRRSVFQICGARMQPTYNALWLWSNSADVVCTICEIRSIATGFSYNHFPDQAISRSQNGWRPTCGSLNVRLTRAWLPSLQGARQTAESSRVALLGSWLILPLCG